MIGTFMYKFATDSKRAKHGAVVLLIREKMVHCMKKRQLSHQFRMNRVKLLIMLL